MPGAFQLARGSEELAPEILQDPWGLLENILEDRDGSASVERLIHCLSWSGYSIANLLADVGRLKANLSNKTISTEHLIEHWMRLDRAVEECVAATASSHEQFIDNTQHAFCRYDGDGIIVGANGKMLALNPDCIGKPLVDYFGTVDKEIRRAVTDHPRRLYELELRAQSGQLPVLAEFGANETGNSGYALFVDISDRVGAEYKALESAPYGMLKLDAKHRIIYATEKATELLELGRDELIGLDARRFLADRESLNTVIKQGIERRRGIGGAFDVRIQAAKSGREIQLKITSIANFDSAGLFCGSILQMQPIDFRRARQEIARLIGTVTDYAQLYKEIIAVLRGFIDFDWANLFLYSPDRKFSRIVCTEGPSIAFVSRWFPTPNGYFDWLDQDVTWMSDLEEVMSQTAPEQLERTDTKAAIDAGMKALVCIPIRSGGRIIAGFCLASKQRDVYDARSRRTLEHLNIAQALFPLFGMIEAAEREFVNGLVKEIARAEDMQQVAEKVVEQLTSFYGYRNVSIFKANIVRGSLQLLAQAVGPDGGKPMPTGYSQPISDGLIGLCYKRGDAAIMKQVGDGSEEARAYITVTKEIRSELCIPIRLFSRVLWILNLEDCLGDAFTLIEITKLQNVIDQVQASLERIFQNLILVKVLDVCPAAVVITDQKHTILRCNRQARQMMQQDVEGDNLDAFFEVPPTSFARDPTAATLLGAKGKGKKIEVLASRITLEEEYDHVVFMLQNVADIEWTTRFETLRAAIAETTAQVRVPVSLISSFVRRIAQQTENDDIGEIAAKASRQIGRIELTYDRVLASYEAKSQPAKRNVSVDLARTLNYILNDLPALDRKGIRVTERLAGTTVTADPYRVFFALNSMMTYLLRSRTTTDPIVISALKRKNAVEVSMTGAVAKTPKARHLAAVVEATRTEIALGKETLVRFAREAGGDFSVVRQKNGRERLSLSFPVSRQDAGP